MKRDLYAALLVAQMFSAPAFAEVSFADTNNDAALESADLSFTVDAAAEYAPVAEEASVEAIEAESIDLAQNDASDLANSDSASEDSPSEASHVALAAEEEPAMDQPSAEFADAVGEQDLNDNRGAAGFSNSVLQISSSTAQMTDVIVNSGITGSNSINDNAFSNSSGMNVVIQNSGNGVIIQNDLQMNIAIH